MKVIIWCLKTDWKMITKSNDFMNKYITIVYHIVNSQVNDNGRMASCTNFYCEMLSRV